MDLRELVPCLSAAFWEPPDCSRRLNKPRKIAFPPQPTVIASPNNRGGDDLRSWSVALPKRCKETRMVARVCSPDDRWKVRSFVPLRSDCKPSLRIWRRFLKTDVKGWKCFSVGRKFKVENRYFLARFLLCFNFRRRREAQIRMNFLQNKLKACNNLHHHMKNVTGIDSLWVSLLNKHFFFILTLK